MALVTRSELNAVLEMSVTDERFEALYAWAVGLVNTVYKGDPDQAPDDQKPVLANVLRSVLTRLATNPAGAQMTSSQDAQVTFPSGSAFTLTAAERDALDSLTPTGPSSKAAFSFSPYRDPLDIA